ncbi:MAG: glycoside hydrolase family 43 protein [Oscillospiraceae bacterium]
MNLIENPILKGFNPDPSVLRVGEDYYIATSTFEWFPGVMIYHSRDLKNWEFIKSPLDRVSQLDMHGVPNSCGVFAPCLTYDNNKFYLIYTIVRTASCFQDTHNYLVTADNITGNWSEPIYLNSTGFDPSLFHDEDGRKWIVNRDCDTRGYQAVTGGILMREYDVEQKKLVGEEYRIFRTTGIIGAEGPHIYRRNGYYYLMLAEGGTDFNHVVSMARSKSIFGPYEIDPCNPMLSSRDNPYNPLQKAGHASYVETQNGECYIAHLVGRPLSKKGRCILGRETAIQKVVWRDDGWLRLENGFFEPGVYVPASDLPEFKFQKLPVRDNFEYEILGYPYQTMRIPLGEDIVTLKERKGFLRIYGRDSLHSKYTQALIARRQQAFCYTASTCMEYRPQNYHQMAGLICLYDTDNFFYLYVTHHENNGKSLNIMVSDLGKVSYPLGSGISIEETKAIYLRANVCNDQLYFSYAVGEEEYHKIDQCFDYSILSDDYYIEKGEYRFTGSFIGLCCQDCYEHQSFADFDFFEYREDI